eukprot:507768-Heterocapsa_arctica.AAC.1
MVVPRGHVPPRSCLARGLHGLPPAGRTEGRRAAAPGPVGSALPGRRAHYRGAAPHRPQLAGARGGAPEPDWRHPLRHLCVAAQRGHRRVGLELFSGSGNFAR